MHPTPTTRYRFGFVLGTTLGNKTHYVNLRKYAERDPEIEFVWAPVDHWTPPTLKTRLRLLPGPLFLRARVLQQARPVLGRLNRFDAVMIHLFEAEVICAIRSYFHSRPLYFSATDEAPVTNPATYPLYPHELRKSPFRRRLRLKLDIWRAHRMSAFFPFSKWVANVLVDDCGVPAAMVHPLHVGLDLELWHSEPRAPRVADQPKRLLFVGSDFVRKGGPLLLQVFSAHFSDRAELHIVSKQAPKDLPPNTFIHDDYEPNDPRFPKLYADADVLVVPTTADTGPLWVFMEAMAMRLPIIGTDTGSNTELVQHGDTGLIVGIGNAEGLRLAIASLLDDPALCARMGEAGRQLVQARYNAGVNVPAILGVMKKMVAERRST